MTPSEPQKSLEARVEALEAVIEIMRLEAEYARVWDTGQAERWADVFTEDGVFEQPPVGDRPGRTVSGREALRRFCAETNAQVTGIHLMHPPHITVDGDTARGGVYFEFKSVRRAAPAETTLSTTAGHYEVTYLRTPDGWKMKRRVEKAIARSTGAFYAV
jgi:hypothetical protein